MLDWLFGDGSDNELGATLPGSDAELCEESETIQAYNDCDAKKKCQEIAEEYGGSDPKATRAGSSGLYDCRFKLWR